jgi:DNA-binding XRE family transcriptional regulator
MKNPIIQIRKSHDLTRKELGHLAGVPYDAVYRTETGLVQHPHKKILDALEKLGYQRGKIIKDYENFVEKLRKRAYKKAINN